MNYRHGYHAGNFADVLKHAVLCWTLRYLQQKEAPLCLIDTHAGSGVYDLGGPEAGKTREAENGIERLLKRSDLPAPIAPYIEQVRKCGSGRYPGSPALLQSLARPNDRVLLCELHPEEASNLKRNLGQAPNLRIFETDGYAKLLSLVPPKEKRGLVLIDPPFEQPDELIALAQALIQAHRKWPNGVYLLWFPVKDRAMRARFEAELQSAHIPKLSLLTLNVAKPEGLSETGLVLANAPFTLEAEWKQVLPWLADALAQGPSPSGALNILSP